MSQELFYTSAPRGLKPGSKGFCTVAMTEGLSNALVERLESLSGYRHIYSATYAQADQNPILYAHWSIAAGGGKTFNVLSRIASAGPDYTQRSNKLAHHIVLGSDEHPAGGPAWLMQQPQVMQTAWSGEPALYPVGRPIPAGDDPPRVCETWASLAGDAGWAGVLADAFRSNPSRPAYIIYPASTDVLSLVAEALALLQPRERWQVTFNTYFTDLPAGLACAWRCCIAGTPAAQEALRAAATGHLVIDLTASLGLAPDSPLAIAARTGQLPAPELAPSLSPDSQPIRPAAPQNLPIVPVAADPSLSQPAYHDWMPPFEATLIERPARSSFNASVIIPWCLAALGLVAAGVLAFLEFRSPSSPPGNPSSSVQVADLQRQLQEMKTARDQDQAARQDAEKERDAASSLRDQVRKDLDRKRDWIAPQEMEMRRKKAFAEGQASAFGDPSRYVLREEYDQLLSQLKKYENRPRIESRPEQANAATRPFSPATLPAASGLPVVVDLPEAKTPAATSVARYPPNRLPGKLSLFLPIAPGGAFSVDDRNPARIVLARPPRSGIGGFKPIAEFALLSDGTLAFEWRTAEPDVEAAQLIRFSRLGVQLADSAADSFQFVKPIERRVPWDQDAAILAAMLPKPAPAEVRLRVKSCSPEWRAGAEAERAVSLVYRERPDDVIVTFNYAAGVVTNDRKTKSFNAHRFAAQCDEDVRKADADLILHQQNAGRAVAELKRLGNNDTPAVKEFRKLLADSKEGETVANRALKAAQVNKGAADLDAKYYKAAPQVELEVTLLNGVYVCAITFE